MNAWEATMKVSALEFKELLIVLFYYTLSGMTLGLAIAPLVVFGGMGLKSNYGLPLTNQSLTALIVILAAVLAALFLYVVLIPAELEIVRRKLKPVLLAKRLMGKK
jgi:hypothetical protein